MKHEACHSCGSDVFFNEVFCTTCWRFDNYPNVKLALVERSALRARETSARDAVIARKAWDPLIRMEQLVSYSGRIVIGMTAHVLWALIRDPKEFYSNYEKRVMSGTRRIAEPEYDAERATGASVLGGITVTAELLYGALSVNGTAPRSYGCVSATLKDVMIAHRVSLLEENSYIFQKKYPVPPPPKGYRATWEDRVALATAKLATSLDPSASDDALRQMILSSDGNRNSETYVEAHIYGRIKSATIERIVVDDPPLSDPEEMFDLRRAYPHAVQMGIAWEPAP